MCAHTTIDLRIGQRLAHPPAGTFGFGAIKTNQRLAGSVHERVDTLRRDVEDFSRLDGRHAEPLAQHHRLALLLGQGGQQSHGNVELVVRFHLVGDRGAGVGMPLAELLVDAAALRHREARQTLVA